MVNSESEFDLDDSSFPYMDKYSYFDIYIVHIESIPFLLRMLLTISQRYVYFLILVC